MRAGSENINRHTMKHYVILLLSVLAYACSSPSADKKQAEISIADSIKETTEPAEEIIGKTFRDYKLEAGMFRQHEDLGGSMLEPLHGIDFGIHLLRKGSDYVLIFEKIRTKEGKAFYEVLDYTEIKGVKENEYINYADCLMDSVPDTEIIALLVPSNDEYHTTILKAWRADRKTRKIVPISTEGIVCYNEGYGEIYNEEE